MATRRERSLQKAEKLVQRGRLEAAIDELRKVLKESPDDTRTLNRVGDLYARLSRVDEAVELFSQAAERFTKEGFFVKAIAIYKKILRLDPTRMPIYDSLAELYRHQGLTNEARAQYQVVADYYEKAEDIAAVVAVYEKLVELDLEDPEMRLRLGELLTAADRLDEAADQYRRAAVVLLEGGEPEAAFRVLERAIETDPKNLEFIMKTVLELRDGSDPELAERFVEAAIAANPEASPARDLLESVAAEDEAVAEPEPEAAPQPEPEPEVEAALEAAAEAVKSAAEPEAAESEEFEIELDAFEETVAAPPEAEPSEAREAEAEPEEAAVAEVAPAEEPAAAAAEIDLDDVLIEADALASYGLAEKAVGRLQSVLDHAPGHLGAYRRLIAIRADERRDVEVVQLASQAATSALESGSAAAWREIVGDLTRRGYRIEGSKIIPPAPPELEVPEELFVDAPEAAESEAAEAEEAPDTAAETVVEAAEPVEAAEDEDDWLDRLTEHRPAEAPAKPEPAAPPADEAEVAPVTAAGEGGEGFFDLGAELAEELEAMEEDLADVTPHEADSVEEIVEGFKRGMAEVLSPEAYDTHYSLGVAYREMGLVDEAIGEFQLAAKDPRYLVECCSLLGQCFQEKDFSDLAIKWYRKGLDSPYISEEETLGLLYELGNLYLANGDRDAARKVFTEIYGSNSNFRDVVAKLEELRGDR